MSLTCLSGLVGLANRDCPCLSAGKPSGFNDSSSGYYLDDRTDGFPVKSALYDNIDCGESTIWDTLEEARNQAIRDVQIDLMQGLQTTRESQIINWNGLIGKAEGSGSYINTNTYSGIQIRPLARMRDAYFIISAVWIDINETKSVPVHVTSNDPTFTPVSVSASVTSSGWTQYELDSPVSLPLYSVNQSDLRYNVSYEPGGAKARQNRIWCCARPAWKAHVDVGAFSEASIPNNELTLPTLNDALGFAVEGHFTCNRLDWICNLDVLNNLYVQDLVARLIQWKASIGLISGVLRSDGVNRATMLDHQGLYRQRNHLSGKYQNAILWIAQNLPSGVTSCWGCEHNQPQLTGLFS